MWPLSFCKPETIVYWLSYSTTIVVACSLALRFLPSLEHSIFVAAHYIFIFNLSDATKIK